MSKPTTRLRFQISISPDAARKLRTLQRSERRNRSNMLDVLISRAGAAAELQKVSK